MELYSVIIILLAIAIGLSPVATKIRLPYPVLLLATGIMVGFIPGLNGLTINPEVVFLIFLPPMLYDAAFHISFKDFKSNIQTISALAIALIFMTTIGIAVIAYYCIPGMTWPLAFVLGAILSPPDAIAASGVIKGLHLPHRTVTILEGESLVNDASALVAFRFAVAAVAGSSFVLWKAGIMFLISLAGGFLVGVVLWMVFAVIVRQQKQNGDVIVGLTILLPFVAYLLAEEIHVSGVIAVVTAGLIISGNKDKFPRQARVQSKSVWDTVIFILGGLIFIMIGLEFPHVLKDIPHDYLLSLIGCSFLIFLTALTLRILFVFWNKKSIDKRIKSMQRFEAAIKDRIHNDKRMAILQQENTATARRKFEAMRRDHEKMLKRIDDLKEYKPLSLKECLIIGWSGMRGIVSLAAALSLPLLMADGAEFPQRSIIIFLTVVTVIFMLVIQGVGLPLLIRWLKIGDHND